MGIVARIYIINTVWRRVQCVRSEVGVQHMYVRLRAASLAGLQFRVSG